MTGTDRDAILSPALGLTIYNTTNNCLETWDGGMWYGPCANIISQYPAGTVFCDEVVTKLIPVMNPLTGKTSFVHT